MQRDSLLSRQRLCRTLQGSHDRVRPSCRPLLPQRSPEPHKCITRSHALRRQHDGRGLEGGRVV
eukprot:13523893-Alexandrium_andersonii.AAC.1